MCLHLYISVTQSQSHWVIKYRLRRDPPSSADPPKTLLRRKRHHRWVFSDSSSQDCSVALHLRSPSYWSSWSVFRTLTLFFSALTAVVGCSKVHSNFLSWPPSLPLSLVLEVVSSWSICLRVLLATKCLLSGLQLSSTSSCSASWVAATRSLYRSICSDDSPHTLICSCHLFFSLLAPLHRRNLWSSRSLYPLYQFHARRPLATWRGGGVVM